MLRLVECLDQWLSVPLYDTSKRWRGGGRISEILRRAKTFTTSCLFWGNWIWPYERFATALYKEWEFSLTSFVPCKMKLQRNRSSNVNTSIWKDRDTWIFDTKQEMSQDNFLLKLRRTSRSRVKKEPPHWWRRCVQNLLSLPYSLELFSD